ncbi:pyruvate dehydrogenase [Aeromicrobium piscarium]|uniref:Pyruvate dehydrogenase n=1 Tax=Aeromicrobium piscarium TaxID=2590901 RepID=A0A554S9W3_9ACTN|nr:pyruvate dehydrogenase [Aeromicrobium piscarium]TSD63144.1 pyruvate dehydrogenase [Aeromicrobium piscarium]
MPTVAEQLIDTLYAAGVRHIYGLVGDSLNPITDAIRDHEDMEWVHCHNEEAAAFAAAAEAQLTGRLAVCAGSCGPGNTHLIQGLFDAHRTGAPVLALASHIPSAQIGTSYFQETHPERLFVECSHWCEMINGPEQMPRGLRIAMQAAVGQRGVAVLVLPGDVSSQDAAHPTAISDDPVPPSTVLPDPARVDRLADLIDEAEKIAIFAGAGVAGSRDTVVSFAELVKAPIGHSLAGKEWIQYDNPFDVGMSGLLGYGACHEALHEADLVLLLGTDFPYDDFLPQKNTVQIDIAPERLGRRSVLELGIVGDVGETLRAVMGKITPKSDESFLDDMLRRHEKALTRVVDAYTKKAEKLVPIHPEYVASVLDEVAADDAIFTVDTGMCNVWAARYITPNGRRRVIGSFRHGTMANALPHAIGAQTAYPDRQVVSMSGDGGLSMLLGELLTAREHDLPVKVVLFNNGSLGMVRLEMLVAGYPYFGTDHPSPDFATIAKGAGIASWTVEKPDEVRGALTDAFAHDGPSLVDIRTDPNALSLPPSITGGQVKGFALAATRTVLDGGVGRMIDLARSNLRNIPR